jgi:hypothetical protein
VPEAPLGIPTKGSCRRLPIASASSQRGSAALDYSFIHFAGVLWTAEGPRQPDWTLWHARLPLHPADPRTPVTLETPSGMSTTATAFDLASVLLQQQPSEASSEEDETASSDGDGDKDSPRKPRPMGSVAALTSGLRPSIESPETGTRARAALEELLQGFDSSGWFAIDFDRANARPWALRANNPPSNFNQQPKLFAKEATALRNARLLVEELEFPPPGRQLRSVGA